jgi:hypothetical protein
MKSSKPTKISRYFEVTPNEGSICQMFNTLNVQLNTQYDAGKKCTTYELFFQNHDKFNVSGQTIDGTEETEEESDLRVLKIALEYLIYHPFLGRKMNKYDVIIHTTSKYIATDDAAKLTTSIRSLISCIHKVSIILQ